jgi:hypothetical protein
MLVNIKAYKKNLNIYIINNLYKMANEIWKVITNYSKYDASNTGKIRNKSRNQELKFYENKDGTIICDILTNNNKRVKKRVDELILNTFESNDNNYTDIIHINNIITDNNIENIKWVSKEELKIFLTNNNEIIKNNTNDNEYWLVIPNYTKYEVSNTGKIRNKFKQELKLFDNKSGYTYCEITSDDNIKLPRRIDKLILDTFESNNNNNTDIIHINNINNDNYIENIKWISKDELKLINENILINKINDNNEIIKNNINDEYWQIIPEFTNYEASNLGEIRNKETQKKIIPYKNQCGYVGTSITNDLGKRKSLLIHQLIALTFIPNPENKPTVDHINRIRDDNKLINLKWATHIEQSKNKEINKIDIIRRNILKYDLEENLIETYNSLNDAGRQNNLSSVTIKNRINNNIVKNNCIFKYEEYNDLEDEIWKNINPLIIDNYEGYLVSNKGRIKNKFDYIFTLQNGGGYYNSRIGKTSFRVHRIVAQTFLPNPTNLPVVNHKDGNKLNNFIENLEWVTYQENSIHAIENNLNPCRKKILQYDLNGIFIKIFDSITEASKFYNCDHSSISIVLTKNSNRKENDRYATSVNYIWLYYNEPIIDNLNLDKPILPIKKKKVLKIDSNNNIINTYNSITSASKDNISSLPVYIKENKSKDGYTYKFLNDY